MRQTNKHYEFLRQAALLQAIYSEPKELDEEIAKVLKNEVVKRDTLEGAEYELANKRMRQAEKRQLRMEIKRPDLDVGGFQNQIETQKVVEMDTVKYAA